MKKPAHKDKEILQNRQENKRLENQSLEVEFYMDGELKQFIETEIQGGCE